MPRTQPAQGFESLDRSLRYAVEAGKSVTDVVGVAAKGLLKAVAADLWCAVLLDPSTLLDTGGIHESGFPESVMPRLFEIEHVEQDGVDNLRALARRPKPVSSLRQSTRGELSSSTYYRDILEPLGLGDEMRVLLRDGGRTWGLLVLCRTSGSTPFSTAELATARVFTGPATKAVRRSLVMTGIDEGAAADGTGLIVLDASQRMVSCSATAARLLAEIQEGASADGPKACPYAVRAVAAAAGALEQGDVARSLVRARGGQWLTLHAWRVTNGSQPLTMVSIGPAEPGVLVALVLEAYGLSERQRQIAQLVLLGWSSREIIAELHITQNTLNDHLEKTFDKIGVRSRRELAAAVFSRHYWPRLGAGGLSLDGRLPNPARAAFTPHVSGVPAPKAHP